MRNIVKIDTGNFLAGYLAKPNSERIPVAFFAIVLLSMALPEITYVAYGGAVPLIVFVAVALAGSTLGLRNYRRFPKRVRSTLDLNRVKTTQSTKDTETKKAA